MANDETKDDNSKLGKALKTLDAKTLVGLISVASLLYAFGFVIVNVHLANKGIRDFEFARPTYLSAGAAFFLHTLFLVLY